MTAGLTTLELISAPGFFEDLSENTRRLLVGFHECAARAGIPLSTNQVGGMFGLFFTDAPQVSRFEHVMACDVERFKRFFHAMLKAGVYLAPSAFEAGFVSSAHGLTEIYATLRAAERAFRGLETQGASV
jgi:glutamate-1-semialdehyde 2,1-aminomutase